MTVKDIILDLEDCITFNRKPEKELIVNAVELIKAQQAEIDQLAQSVIFYEKFSEMLKEMVCEK